MNYYKTLQENLKPEMISMDIPQVSISIDTSDSGAQSVETCRELVMNSKSDNDGEDDQKNADSDSVKNIIEKTGAKCVNDQPRRTMPSRSLTLGSGNSNRVLLSSNCSALSSRSSLTCQLPGVSRRILCNDLFLNEILTFKVIRLLFRAFSIHFLLCLISIHFQFRLAIFSYIQYIYEIFSE